MSLLKHRVRINVVQDGERQKVLEGADMKLPSKIIRWLFGDFQVIYLLSPGQTIQDVEIHEKFEKEE